MTIVPVSPALKLALILKNKILNLVNGVLGFWGFGVVVIVLVVVVNVVNRPDGSQL